jgi:hypothetical protein
VGDTEQDHVLRSRQRRRLRDPVRDRRPTRAMTQDTDQTADGDPPDPRAWLTSSVPPSGAAPHRHERVLYCLGNHVEIRAAVTKPRRQPRRMSHYNSRNAARSPSAIAATSSASLDNDRSMFTPTQSRTQDATVHERAAFRSREGRPRSHTVVGWPMQAYGVATHLMPPPATSAIKNNSAATSEMVILALGGAGESACWAASVNRVAQMIVA